MQPRLTHDEKPAQGTDFLDRPIHRLWLLEQARDLLDFFLLSSINPDGGFFTVNRMGAPVSMPATGGQVRKLHSTTRMVHCAVRRPTVGWS